MSLERKDFRRQLHMFQKWQVENKELREKAKHQEMQVDPSLAIQFSRSSRVVNTGINDQPCNTSFLFGKGPIENGQNYTRDVRSCGDASLHAERSLGHTSKRKTLETRCNN